MVSLSLISSVPLSSFKPIAWEVAFWFVLVISEAIAFVAILRAEVRVMFECVA